jgi:uncharacterized protein YbjT (DUF2867 family)
MSSKTISILGGTGYVGRRIILELLQRGGKNMKIYSVSRRGSEVTNKVSDIRVEYIKGDGLYPSTFEEVIKASDGIVHSVGVLFSSQKDEEKGSYNMVNKETCLRVASLANTFSTPQSKKNLVFVSASKGMPFPLGKIYSGYFQAKIECEEGLKKLENLNSVILKAGFIKDAKDRWWSVPLALGTDSMNFLDKAILQKVSPKVSDFISLPDQSIQLETVARYSAAGALGLIEPRAYLNEEMNSKPLV